MREMDKPQVDQENERESILQNKPDIDEMLEDSDQAEAVIESANATEETVADPAQATEETGGRKRTVIIWNQNFIQVGLILLFCSMLVLLFYYLLFHTDALKQNFAHLNRILLPVLVGIALAYVMTPLLNAIERRILKPLYYQKLKRKETDRSGRVIRYLSVTATCTLFILALWLVLKMLISGIVPSVGNLISNFDVYTSNAIKWANSISFEDPDVNAYLTLAIDSVSESISEWFNTDIFSKSTTILKNLSLGMMSFGKKLLDFVVGFIISVYLLNSKEVLVGRFKKIIYAALSRKKANDVVDALWYTHQTFSGFLTGKFVDSVIIGLLCFIGTTLMQTPYAALVSLIIGITNMIPFFGPYIGAIPTTLLIFMVNPSHPLPALYFLIFIILLQQLDGNVIGPKILGKSTGLEGFWVIFAITLFGGIWGLFGMIVGVPFFAVLYNGIRVTINGKLAKKGYTNDTKQYMNAIRVDEDGIVIQKPEAEPEKIRPFSRKTKKTIIKKDKTS